MPVSRKGAGMNDIDPTGASSGVPSRTQTERMLPRSDQLDAVQLDLPLGGAPLSIRAAEGQGVAVPYHAADTAHTFDLGDKGILQIGVVRLDRAPGQPRGGYHEGCHQQSRERLTCHAHLSCLPLARPACAGWRR